MKGLSEFHFQSIGKLTRLVAMTKPSRILQSMPNVITLIDIITYDICIYQMTIGTVLLLKRVDTHLQRIWRFYCFWF